MLIWVADRRGWGNANSATQDVSCQPTFPRPTQTQSASNVAHQKGILIYSGTARRLALWKIRKAVPGGTCTLSLLKTSLACLTGHSGPASRPSLMAGIRQGQKSHWKPLKISFLWEEFVFRKIYSRRDLNIEPSLESTHSLFFGELSPVIGEQIPGCWGISGLLSSSSLPFPCLTAPSPTPR